MRIALAKVLLARPDFLLLDEPTNYLDVEARVWLGSFLSGYAGGVLMVSHDRRFLDESVNTVWELFLSDVKRYRGSYSDYERQRELEIAQIKADWARQQEEIKRIEDFIRRFRATASKAKQVQSRVKQLEKMELIQIPEHLKHVRITFPAAPRSGREVITIRGVARGYGENSVLEDVDLIVQRGERVVLVGPNGAGKSTLLRIVAGQDQGYEGDVVLGAGVSLGYYADDDSWLSKSLAAGDTDSGPTVLQATLDHAHGQTEQRIRDLLGAFLFRGDDIYKSVHVLSGGERSRLSMLQLLLQPHNLLVLDEPTNHLDLASKEVLAGALDQFGGTIVFVSHDREFIEGLATRVIELKPNPANALAASHLSDFPGDYHYYAWRLEHAGEELEHRPPRAAGSTASQAGEPAAPPAALSHEEQKERRARRARLQKAVDSLMIELESLESRHDEIQDDLARPEVYADPDRAREVNTALQEIARRIDETTSAWEEAADDLERFERESET
jgi:ATP-binding cassette subfamily F protein 3